jgi:hypothetical protein
MKRTHPFGAIPRRNLEQALVHRLETEYKLLGSHRLLQLVAQDLVALVEQFYPPAERVSAGQLVWTTTQDEGRKAVVGKRTEEYASVTVTLPFLTAEDVAVKLERCETPDGKARAHQEDLKRLARIVQAAAEQGGLLTLAELAVLLNRSLPTVGEYVAEHYEATGELLPLRGYRMDQGSAPTHKGQIARLWEGGREPPDIARETSHSLKAVERYVEDYKRVRELLRRGLKVAEISQLIGRGRKVVVEYIEIVCEFHPDLQSGLD